MLLKTDFKFDFEALERMEDSGIYFGALDQNSYKDLVLFFSACNPHVSKDEILGAVLGGRMPVTVDELIEQLVDDTKKL